jgi:hypothetical protein
LQEQTALVSHHCCTVSTSETTDVFLASKRALLKSTAKFDCQCQRQCFENNTI